MKKESLNSFAIAQGNKEKLSIPKNLIDTFTSLVRSLLTRNFSTSSKNRTRLIVCGRARSGTTITRDILHNIPGVALTSEGCLYHAIFMYEDPVSLLQFLYEKLNVVEGNKMFGYGERIKEITPEQIDGQSKLERIRFIEQQLFGDKKIIGDKTYIDAASFLSLNALDNQKYIYIYRDGRDVISSSYRLFKKRSRPVNWSNDNVKSMCNHWVSKHRQWRKFVTNPVNKSDLVELRYEDYFENKQRQIRKISNLLQVPQKDVAEAIDTVFSVNSSNSGYYKEWFPNWREEFTREAIELLEELGYI